MPIYSSKALYGDAYQLDYTGSTVGGPGDGFSLDSGTSYVQFNSAMGSLGLGTTSLGVQTSFCLRFQGQNGDTSHGAIGLNGGAIIPAGTTVEVSMWMIRDSASHDDGSGNGMTLGATGNHMEDAEFVNLEQADNVGFSSGLAYVATKWRKSTTLPGSGDDYTELGDNGRIGGDEIPQDSGFGNGGTLHHYRITFTVPSGGKFYRLSKSVNGTDYTYHYGLHVMMSPAVITSTAAESATRRDVYINESKPSHASINLAAATTATAGSHTPFGGNGGTPTVLSMTGGIKYDSTNGKFTVQDDGFYEIHVVGQIINTSTGNGLSSFRVMKNAGYTSRTNLIWKAPDIGSSADYEASYVLHGIFRLSAGNFVQLFVDTADGGTVSLQQGSTFTIQRVG